MGETQGVGRRTDPGDAEVEGVTLEKRKTEPSRGKFGSLDL